MLFWYVDAASRFAYAVSVFLVDDFHETGESALPCAPIAIIPASAAHPRSVHEDVAGALLGVSLADALAIAAGFSCIGAFVRTAFEAKVYALTPAAISASCLVAIVIPLPWSRAASLRRRGGLVG